MTSKSLKFFKFELYIHDYVRVVYTSANFHFKPIIVYYTQLALLTKMMCCASYYCNYSNNKILTDFSTFYIVKNTKECTIQAVMNINFCSRQ